MLFRVAQMPKALMRRNQALNAFAAVGIRRHGSAGEHGFQNMEQLLGNLIIALVAGMVEGEQDFIGQPAAVAWRTRAGFGGNIGSVI